MANPNAADGAFFEAQSEKRLQRLTTLDAVYTEVRIAFASGALRPADVPALYDAFLEAQVTRKGEGWEW